jgi:hypothetical protein
MPVIMLLENCSSKPSGLMPWFKQVSATSGDDRVVGVELDVR